MARFRRGYGLSVSGYWASGDYDLGHPLLMGKNLPEGLGRLWDRYSPVCDHGSPERARQAELARTTLPTGRKSNGRRNSDGKQQTTSSAHSDRLGNDGLQESHAYLKLEFTGTVGDQIEIVGFADGDGLDGWAHRRLGGGERPAVFGGGTPLDRLRFVVEEGYGHVGIVGADVDEAQVILCAELQ